MNKSVLGIFVGSLLTNLYWILLSKSLGEGEAPLWIVTILLSLAVAVWVAFETLTVIDG